MAGVKIPLDDPLLGGKNSFAPEMVYAKSTVISASADREASASAVISRPASRLNMLDKRQFIP